MKKCILPLLAMALAPLAAQAQFTDHFDGPRLLPPWNFDYPIGYEDPEQYTVGNGQFIIQAHNGSINGGFITNTPSVTVKSGASTDYDIKLTSSAVFNYPAREVFGAWGLIIFTDQNNFFTFNTAHAGAANGDASPHNINFLDTELKTSGNNVGRYDGLLYLSDNTFTDYDGSNAPVNPVVVGANPAAYHLKKVGTTITLSYQVNGGTETTLTTISSTDSDSYKSAVYAFLSDLSNKHVGVFAGEGYDQDLTEPVTFSNFSISLPTVIPPPSFDDELNGTGFSSAWSFSVPGNTPLNTEDKTHYNFGSGKFNVTLQPGILQSNNALNVPSVTAGSGNSGDWYIEASLNAPFTSAQTYPSADLVIFTDTGNFMIFKDQNAGFIDPANPFSPTPGTQYASVDLFTGGQTATPLYDSDVATGFPIYGEAVFRISKTKGTGGNSDVITLSYNMTHPTYAGNQNEKTIAILDNTVTDAQKRLFDFLESIDGKHVGFFANDNGYTAITDVVSFDSLRTTLNIVTPVAGSTVTGTLALDGVSDLSATNPAVPVGNLTFDFFAANSATHTAPLFTKTAALTPIAGTNTGTFALTGVTAGNYDIGISSSKSLRAVVKNVNANSNVALPGTTTLLGGNANGDTVVNFDDFLTLLNAFGSKISDPASGFDPTADFDYNGIVNFDDFLVLLNNFGAQSDK